MNKETMDLIINIGMIATHLGAILAFLAFYIGLIFGHEYFKNILKAGKNKEVETHINISKFKHWFIIRVNKFIALSLLLALANTLLANLK